MPGEVLKLTVKCSKCGAKGEIICGKWAIRITGGVEIVCPACNHRTTWVGQYGHALETEQKIADAESLGVVAHSEGGENDGSGTGTADV